MTSLFITAFFLGLVFNAAPGAVFAESMRRGIKGGYYPALYVQIGSLVGDATWAILGLLGAGFLMQLPATKIPLTVIGGIYLAYLGIQSLKESYSTDIKKETLSSGDSSDMMAGVTISLTNPANIFYWAALGSILVSLGVQEPTLVHYVVFFTGFMTSSIMWGFLCAGFIHLMHKSMPDYVVRIINLVCGLTLIFLSFQAIYNVLIK
ncbi:chemosensory pili system protein ChpE [Thiothrix eikelboomii]|uniref:Chemosensory pili system protein ChpE n=1 Tax=Thiothrix eikelboomii TaxID=92487 RepID=A0A1T4WEI7_9GAMM|nr:LysE family transporter [Thiothrix eikelboomii]SKA75724.1 chemosensory pili system protein ChpE [Thiothrix eikelboomii]